MAIQIGKFATLKDSTTKEAQELKQVCWKSAVEMGDMGYVHKLRKVLPDAESKQLLEPGRKTEQKFEEVLEQRFHKLIFN